MAEQLTAAALLLGLTAAAAVVLRTRSVRLGVPVLLDYLLAAGLLRLSVDLSWEAIGATVIILGIRRLVAIRLALRPES